MVFIGGLQRSGTTLLGRALASAPGATGLVGTPTAEDEGQFVQTVYMDDHVLGSRGISRAGRVSRWAYHPAAHLVEQDADSRLRAKETLLREWEPYVAETAAGTLIEKSPSNLTRTRFLQRLFPDASFIMVRRHPITQALAVRKWADYLVQAGFTLGSVIEHWVHAMSVFDSDRHHLKRVKVIAFEDLMSNPALVLQDCAEFLGLDAPTAFDAMTMADDTYVKYWERMKFGRGWSEFTPLYSGTDLNSRLRRLAESAIVPPLGKRITRKVEYLYGEAAREFGYEIGDLAVAHPWPFISDQGVMR